MSRITSVPEDAAEILGERYPINTGYRNALLTWDVFEAAHCGEVTAREAAVVAIENIFLEPRPPVCPETMNAIQRYLERHTRTGGQKDTKPVIDFNQDGQLLYDAFLLAGHDLDKDYMPFSKFMAVFRELPKDATICRIVYLRQMIQKGKLTKELKEEIQRVGMDVIRIRGRGRDDSDTEDYFKAKRDELRAARGLPLLTGS